MHGEPYQVGAPTFNLFEVFIVPVSIAVKFFRVAGIKAVKDDGLPVGDKFVSTYAYTGKLREGVECDYT